MAVTLRDSLAEMAGRTAPIPDHVAIEGFPAGGLGFSQFNEVLLSLGYDRVPEPFFAFLVQGTPEYESGMTLENAYALSDGITRFQKFAIERFGSIRKGFYELTHLDAEGLAEVLEWSEPIPLDRYESRHEPVHAIEAIPAEKTPLLGYLTDGLIRSLREAGDEEAASELESEAQHFKAIGIRNQTAYLASDHMDVYVATSMRNPHEYVAVREFTTSVFERAEVSDLKPRYFDPTQAFCENRIDKGLAEALMLKRVKCTIYLVQESDTLGKDSELASTLAQGKPVIAFVPSLDVKAARAEIERAVSLELGQPKGASYVQKLLGHLQLVAPSVAWTEGRVREWLADPESADPEDVLDLAAECLIKHLDKRAKTLKEQHPLGIQVHLESGVANGVLVARTISECAALVRAIMTNELQFDLERGSDQFEGSLLLRERMTGSVFRVVTGDDFLTNAFWNYYL